MVAPELRNVGVELLEGRAEYPGDRGRMGRGRHGQGGDGVEQGVAAASRGEVADHEGHHRAGADGAEDDALGAGVGQDEGRRDTRAVLVQRWLPAASCRCVRASLGMVAPSLLLRRGVEAVLDKQGKVFERVVGRTVRRVLQERGTGGVWVGEGVQVGL